MAPMRWRIILAVLAIFACSFGCQSEKEKAIPDALIGVWKTSAPGYENNSLELRKDEILFGVGRSEFSANSIFKVKTVRPDGERTSLITIYYTDGEGKDNAVSIYYDQTPPGSIRFKNQKQIEWKLFERRPPGQVSLSRRRPAGSWWKHSNLNIVLALLGASLTIGAALWRLQESRAGRLAAPVENVEPESAQQKRGGREFSEMMVEEGGTDWSQAPTAVPEIAVKEQRRSERILLKVPVHVAGVDADGKSFEERTFTLSINRHGAFIALSNSPQEGDHVMVTHLGTRQSCAFRLCESGKDPSGEVTAWGIECLEPNANFWKIRFPDKPPEPLPRENITALIVCTACHSREVAELSLSEYHTMLDRGLLKRDCSDCGVTTEWKFILVEAMVEESPQETPSVSLPPGEEKRREKRIVAKLPIRLRHPGDGRMESSLTENVSKSGVCCAASMELNVGDVILLTFEFGTGPSEDENPARIMWRRPMGENRKTIYGIRLERKES
jgi:hypothetical protein